MAKHPPLHERFFRRVRVTPHGCHEWTGHRTLDGYGRIKEENGPVRPATHAAWYLAYGEWPTQFMLHTCDNPSCVNVDHLYQGTPRQNTQDALRRGRIRTGEDSPIAVYSNNDVQQAIFRVYSGESQTAVAKDIGMSLSHLSRIVCGKTNRSEPIPHTRNRKNPPPPSRLGAIDVAYIKEARAQGVKLRLLAEELGVSMPYLCNICKGRGKKGV